MSEHAHVKDAIKCINLGHPDSPNLCSHLVAIIGNMKNIYAKV